MGPDQAPRSARSGTPTTPVIPAAGMDDGRYASPMAHLGYATSEVSSRGPSHAGDVVTVARARRRSLHSGSDLAILERHAVAHVALGSAP